MMVMEGGYPRDLFVEPVAEELVCILCQKVLRSARATPCRHVFCKGCVEPWVAQHGVCPQRCAQLSVKNLAGAGHIDNVVSGLTTRCKNADSGCKVQVPLREKAAHESKCPHRHRRRESGALDVDWEEEEKEEEKESLGFFQRATKIVLSFRSRNARKKSTPGSPSADLPPSSEAGSMLIQRTYRLKRNKPKEPLGLVLLSGDKTSDGRHKSYYVKKVNRDTLGWRAGIQAGDRIIKIDDHDLRQLTPRDSVARIKEKSVVTLTVLREMGSSKHSKTEPPTHIYDEIDLSSADYNQLSQHALSQPLPAHSLHSYEFPSLPPLSQFDENHPPTPPPVDFPRLSPSAQQKLRLLKGGRNDRLGGDGLRSQRNSRAVSPGAHVPQRASPSYGQGERTSKDSGLSSGSSDSAAKHLDVRVTASGSNNTRPTLPAVDLNRDINVRKSYRTEQEMVRKFIKERRRNGPALPPNLAASKQPVNGRNCRIVGDYELEDIHLQKNGTSQLGITLGYDSSAAHGSCLYVCEVVAGGLAAQDGRIRTGDIIQKVNGFRVFDPEEAILLFLEQDQDITLSVARKIKVLSKLHPQPEPNLDFLESTLNRDGLGIRKVDSCGSLDSHTHHVYATLEPPPTLEPPSDVESSGENPIVMSDKQARSHDLHLMATSHDCVSEATTMRMRLMAMSRDSITSSSASRTRQHDDDPFNSRRGSNPGHALGGSRPITGSSPNLLRIQHSPPSLTHHASSGTNLTVVALPTAHGKHRAVENRPSSTSPEGKLGSPVSSSNGRPIGGVISHQKLSSPNLLDSPAGREPRIMSPLSPSAQQTPPSFHGFRRDFRRLPNRYDRNLELSAAGGVEGRRESLV